MTAPRGENEVPKVKSEVVKMKLKIDQSAKFLRCVVSRTRTGCAKNPGGVGGVAKHTENLVVFDEKPPGGVGGVGQFDKLTAGKREEFGCVPQFRWQLFCPTTSGG